MAKNQRILQRIVIMPIRCYQLLISPLLGQHCRFYPSCSQFTVQAIETHGCIKGIFFGFLRVLRCHPWSKGGLDPVPTKKR